MNRHPIRLGVLVALAAAVTFGMVTPILQRLSKGAGPFATAALLYAGAAMAMALRGRGIDSEAPVRREHLPRVVVIAILGAVVAPACLAWALQRTSASTASLLLNSEVLFTILLARVLYREPIGMRVGAALVFMVFASVLLVGLPHSEGGGVGWSSSAVLAASLAWAADNTLMRPLSDLNPRQVVLLKGTVGSILSVGISLILTERYPGAGAALAILLCGAAGYGLSLRLCLLAQRRMGAARTASIFSLGPFVGALAAFGMGAHAPIGVTLLAGLLFGVGVALHLNEQHGHTHNHDPVEHEHVHTHDDGHHDHVHDPPVVGQHSHGHRHHSVSHDHPHAPDLHHQHGHG